MMDNKTRDDLRTNYESEFWILNHQTYTLESNKEDDRKEKENQHNKQRKNFFFLRHKNINREKLIVDTTSTPLKIVGGFNF